MSDRTASQVSLILIALSCLALVIFEAALAVHYLVGGRQDEGTLLAVISASSLALFSWMAYGVAQVESEEDAEEGEPTAAQDDA